MNDYVRPCNLKPQQRNLTPVLRPPIEPTVDKRTYSETLASRSKPLRPIDRTSPTPALFNPAPAEWRVPSVHHHLAFLIPDRAAALSRIFHCPFGMGWVKSQESISVISELDLTFMLFMIGLEIDLKKIVVGSSCLPPADNWRAAVCSACSS